jgi:hypothetical protein
MMVIAEQIIPASGSAYVESEQTSQHIFSAGVPHTIMYCTHRDPYCTPDRRDRDGSITWYFNGHGTAHISSVEETSSFFPYTLSGIWRKEFCPSP